MESNQKINNNNSNIIKFKNFFDITYNSFIFSGLNNTFSVFKTHNNLLFLIYADTNNSIICHELEKNQKICEIHNSHRSYIGSFIHYYDKKKRKNLIIYIHNQLNNRFIIIYIV